MYGEDTLCGISKRSFRILGFFALHVYWGYFYVYSNEVPQRLYFRAWG